MDTWMTALKPPQGILTSASMRKVKGDLRIFFWFFCLNELFFLLSCFSCVLCFSFKFNFIVQTMLPYYAFFWFSWLENQTCLQNKLCLRILFSLFVTFCFGIL